MGTDVRAIIAERIRKAYGSGGPTEAHAAALLGDFDAHGVVLITDLPRVHDDGDGYYRADGHVDAVDGKNSSAADTYARAVGLLAIARHKQQEPDPADVEAMAAVLRRTSAATGVDGADWDNQACRLLRAGVRPPKAGA